MAADDNTVPAEYKRGLELARGGAYFEAHEAFETAWRAAAPRARLLPGPRARRRLRVPGRPRQGIGAERQREKAIRRLGATHRRIAGSTSSTCSRH
jgi:predicted metal-dependent hydrolase